MDRLTISDHISCFNYDLKDHKHIVGEFGEYDTFFNYSMAVKRLGEYEDTGLTPDEILKLRDSAPLSVEFDIGDEGFLFAINRAFKKQFRKTPDEIIAENTQLQAETAVMREALELAELALRTVQIYPDTKRIVKDALAPGAGKELLEEVRLLRETNSHLKAHMAQKDFLMPDEVMEAIEVAMEAKEAK